MKLPNAVAKDQLAHLTDRLNSGYIRVYAGTVPSDADVALTTQTLLATLRFSATAFLAPVDMEPGAYADANTIISEADADADGTLTFVRLYEDDNVTLVMQLTAGESEDSEVVFEDSTVAEGGTVSLQSMRLMHGE